MDGFAGLRELFMGPPPRMGILRNTTNSREFDAHAGVLAWFYYPSHALERIRV
jgi:hypothetical protein